jgi:predicted cobalt transporter CbtA
LVDLYAILMGGLMKFNRALASLHGIFWGLTEFNGALMGFEGV